MPGVTNAAAGAHRRAAAAIVRTIASACSEKAIIRMTILMILMIIVLIVMIVIVIEIVIVIRPVFVPTRKKEAADELRRRARC